MHVSDDDSNMLCKYDEIWWTLNKMLKFHDISKRWHCRHISMKKIEPLWMGSKFTCMFQMMIQINTASLMKFGELWKNVEI